MIDDGGGLVVLGVLHDLPLEIQRAILELVPSEVSKVRIDRAREVQALALHSVLHIEVVRVEQCRYLVRLEHPFEDGCVTLRGQRLVRIAEVPSVKVVTHGNASGHLRPELSGVLRPLLVRVGLEDELVQPLPHPGQRHLLRVRRIAIGVLHLLLRQPPVHLVRILDLQIEQSVHGVDVDRDGNVLPLDLPQDLVLVLCPVRELSHVLPHSVVLGVEQVRTILRHPYPRLVVDVVIAVSADVIPLFDDERGLSEHRGVPFGDDGPGQPGPDHAVVVLLGEHLLVNLGLVVLLLAHHRFYEPENAGALFGLLFLLLLVLLLLGLFPPRGPADPSPLGRVLLFFGVRPRISGQRRLLQRPLLLLGHPLSIGVEQLQRVLDRLVHVEVLVICESADERHLPLLLLRHLLIPLVQIFVLFVRDRVVRIALVVACLDEQYRIL
mmetsp:Transcript_19240/g.35905  ORF Transcript_19240/g.35905 Transcript_19240/m.35905 type:complete len:438 (-) Transcript_19240:1345-2658(-)